MPGRYTDAATCTVIMNMRRRGVSIYKIGAMYCIHPSTVSWICKRFGKQHSNFSNKPKPGCPRTLSPSDVRFAALSLAQTRNFTVVDLKQEFFPTVSTETIRRALRQVGLHAYIRRKVPFINARNRCAHVLWATEHLMWTLGQWLWVRFSDKSKYNIFGSDGKQYTWHRPGESLDPRYTSKQIKHGGGNIAIWGCVTQKGPRRLYRIDGILTGARYTEILEEALLGTLEDHHIRISNFVFQHNNDPKHTSKAAKSWLKSRAISVLPWPSSSPNLNIIKHVWDYVDRKVRSRSKLPKNREQLWEALQEEWHCIPLSFITKLYESIPSRIRAVIDADGGNTRY